MKVRRGIFLCLWILSLALISFYGGVISYGLFFALTLIPVISVLYLAAVYLRFKIYQELESRNAVCGQPVPYFFVLQNDDHFAFSSVSVRLFSTFSYVEELPDGVEYELLPGDKFTYRTNLVCKYRGEYEVGVKEIVITDFFRLFRLRYSVPGTIRALVLPRIVRVKELVSIEEIAAMMQRQAWNADTEPDVVVRDYVEGDALKQISWKATAREQKLKVRNRTGEEKQGISVFLDTRRYAKDRKEYLPLENKLLEVLLALGIFFAEKEMGFTAYYGQDGIVSDRVGGIRDFDRFYQRSSGVSFEERENSRETLFRLVEQGMLQNSKVVFCVLHTLDDGIMEITGRMAQSGSVVVIYVVTGENLDSYVKQSSQRRKIVVLPVEAELEGRL